MMSKSAILMLVVAVATLVAQAPKPGVVAHTAAEMEPMLAQIATYEYGQSRVPLSQFTQFVQDSMASPALLKEIEARLLRFLQSNATVAAKTFAYRELGLIGTGASVPFLSGMLAQPDTSDMARYALARIPGAGVDEALRKMLEKTSGRVKIGIINSLGQRRDAKSVPVLKALVSSSDSAVAEAAATALADIADRPSLDALAGALGKARGPLELRVAGAYLRCADQFAARGDKAAASKVYRQLLAREEPQALRVAALRGLVETAGREAVPALTAELSAKSQVAQAAAVRLLSQMPGPEITALLVGQFPKSPPSAQPRLLAALADRGDTSARPLFQEALKSGTVEVRSAAVAGLGKLGDASSVMVLAETAASSEGGVQKAARESLYGLRGPGIDPAIVASIGSASGKVKIELIAAAGERVNSAAAETLLQAARAGDPDVRRESIKALRNVAGPAHVPALLDLLLKSSQAAERREATRTLAIVLKRSEPGPVGPVVAAYESAGTLESQVSLIEVAGQTSSESALPLLRKCLADSRPEIARAAVLALTEWSNPAPLPDLLAIAKSSPNPGLQVLALRGYFKVLAVPSPRSRPESVQMIAEAMPLAKQPTEKMMALSLLATYPCKEALALAEAFTCDAAVAKEAKTAVRQISSAMKQR